MALKEQWQNVQQAMKALRITLQRSVAPSTAPALPSVFRGYPVLRRDGSGRMLCTACGLCAQTCPTQCIATEPFHIDETRCMYCGLCAAICPENALELSSALGPGITSNRARETSQ